MENDVEGMPVDHPKIARPIGSRIMGGKDPGIVEMIAGKATGAFGSYPEACERFIRRDRVFEPDGGRNEAYRTKFEHYRQLYPRLKDLLAVVGA